MSLQRHSGMRALLPIGATLQEATESAKGQLQNATPVTGNGRLAQPARASVLHTEGRRFESSTAHHERMQSHWWKEKGR